MSLTARDCNPGHAHRFDQSSGWCLNGCGCRSDGRVTTRQGAVIYPGPPQPTSISNEDEGLES